MTEVFVRRTLLMLLGLVLPTAAVAQRPVPVLGDKRNALLDLMHEDVRRKLPDFAHANLQRYVIAVAARLRPGEADELNLAVVDSLDPLSNVIPGRSIFLSAALFARLQTEAELAALLAHQIGHFRVPIVRDMTRPSILSLVLTAEGFCARFVSEGTPVPFGPQFTAREQEADLRALTLLRAAGYDSSALADVRRRTPTAAKLLPGETRLVVATEHQSDSVVTSSTFDRLRAEVAETLRQRQPRRRLRLR